MTRLLFISSFDYPSRYAHAIHGMYMAQALAKHLPGKFLFFVNTAVKDIGVPYRTLFGSFGRTVKKLRLRRILAPLSLCFFFLTHPEWRGKGTILYTTDPTFFAVCGFLKKMFGFRFVAECHGTLSNAQKKALQEADTPFFVTEGLLNRHSLPNARVLPNAVDVEAFDAVTESRESLRKRLYIPEDGLLVGYIGRFEPLGYDKGLTFMIDMLKDTPGVHLLLVGGSKDEVASYTSYAAFRGLSDRVRVVGHVDSSLVPVYAKACDALAYVPQDKNAFFEEETSPMKLYEYMAASRPIIVSDTPALREILASDEAFFIPQGGNDAYVHAFLSIQNNPADAGGRAEKAYARVRANTWDERARHILLETEP